MNRRAFLLGLFSVGGQVLILREVVSTFHGNELLIGTTLFGWLSAVAVGAYLGGKPFSNVSPGGLFVLGAVALPALLVAIRLSPLAFSPLAGDFTPFTTAAVVSLLTVIPVGIISGWLFPTITKSGYQANEDIARVYLFEGVGAFAGGVLLVFLVGELLSSLGAALFLGVLVLTGNVLPEGRRASSSYLWLIPTVLIVGYGIHVVTPPLEESLDQIKYESYRVESSFDTHYGHQTLLSRDSTYVLLTDNTVEAVYPDWSGSEHLLIPPLLYQDSQSTVLFVGRPEFGIAQLAERFPGLSLTAVDPREFEFEIGKSDAVPVAVFKNDPVAFFTRAGLLDHYDVVILPLETLDSYKSSRYLTGRFLSVCQGALSRDGVLYVPTAYDTDRYVTPETARLLATIRDVLRRSFERVHLWPGANTLVFASDSAVLDVPYDSIQARLASLPCQPAYVNDYYLWDRFAEYKISRLDSALTVAHETNSLNRPVISLYQASYRARLSGGDKWTIDLLFKQPVWLVPLLLVLVLFGRSVTGSNRNTSLALFLYFIAGLVSLILELLTFYLYQATTGSLYLEMSLLIGGFMLGLAVGTYYSLRWGDRHSTAPAALLLLLLATVLFLFTHERVTPRVSLIYYTLFLFTAAAATGSLFVAATNRYYDPYGTRNRGVGYAFELFGSAIGALFATTVLLPLIGLQWLLISIIIVLALALAAVWITSGGKRKTIVIG